MFRRQKNIFIKAPVEQVFCYVADIKRHSEWSANQLEIQHIAGPEHGVGSEFATIIHRPAGFAGMFRGSIRVLIEEQPNLFVYETKDTTGHYRWSFMLKGEQDGCRLTQQIEKLSGPWILKWVQPTILWPLIGSKQVQTGLIRIKTQLEN